MNIATQEPKINRRRLFAALPAFAATATGVMAYQMPDAPVQEPPTPDWWRDLVTKQETTEIEGLYAEWKDAVRLRDHHMDGMSEAFHAANARGDNPHHAERDFEREFVDPHTNRQFAIEKRICETPANTMRDIAIKTKVLLCDIGVLDERAQRSIMADAARHLGEAV